MSIEELLTKMSTLMFFNGEWHARAQGADSFCKASTPREAMELAIFEDLFR